MNKVVNITSPMATINRFLEQTKIRTLVCHGPGGTGKSALIRKIATNYDGRSVMLAPTGIAASHIKGKTIHSYCGVRPNHNFKGTPKNSAQYKPVDLILIDEFSMVSCELIEYLDRFLRVQNNKKKEIFGGVKVIMFGDECQLPPVEGEPAVRSKLFHGDPFKRLSLKHVYRQEDRKTVDVLKRIRKGSGKKIGPALDYVNKICAQKEFDLQDAVAICATNQRVLKRNGKLLKKYCSGPYKKYRSVDQSKLRLGVGARVIATENDPKRRFYNGSFGTVTQIGENGPRVLFDGLKNSVLVLNSIYSEKDTEAGSRIPLKLGYAITVHKAQGQTFDRVYIDLTDQLFASGQLYVALSRVRSLGDLGLSRKLTLKDVKPAKELTQYLRHYQKWI